MTTKSILVTMSGYPMAPSCFMPDNGLAQLASCLIEQGNETIVYDLNTPELMDRLFPSIVRSQTKDIFRRKIEGAIEPSDLLVIEDIEKQIDAHQKREFWKIGEELAKTVKKEKADWVGFKLWNGDGFTGSVIMAKALKSILPEIPTIAGGSHVDFFGEYLTTFETGFDFFCIREGESSIVNFSDYISGKLTIEHVPNLFYVSRGKIIHNPESRVENLDSLPQATYESDVYPAMLNPGKMRVGVVEESRGCPHKCAFCNHPLKAGNRIRFRDVDAVVDEIARLKKAYQMEAFKLGGSYTPTHYKRKLAQRLIDKNLQIEFCGYGRIGKSKKSDFNLLREAGCRALFFGVETGSQLLLDGKINKGYQTTNCYETLRASKDAGIFTIASLIYPNPGETEETRLETLKLIDKAKPDGAPVHFPMVLPGSTWWSKPEDYGFTIPDRENYLKNIVSYKAHFLFPPSYWPDMGFSIDKKDFQTFSKQTADMTEEIEKMGITTLVSDDTALLAIRSSLTVREFRDICRLAMVTGDANTMQDLVNRVNR